VFVGCNDSNGVYESNEMECLIGIQCKNFVLVAADMTTTQSIIVMKNGKTFVTFS